MRPYAEHLRKWIAFDGPAPADVILRLEVAFDRGDLTREEFVELLDTVGERIATNAPGGIA